MTTKNVPHSKAFKKTITDQVVLAFVVMVLAILGGIAECWAFERVPQFGPGESKDPSTTTCFVPRGFVSIHSAEEFIERISLNPNGSYFLCNNIDFEFELMDPFPLFSGVLDGNGYAIKNFVGSSLEVGGLFESISGTVRNLTLTCVSTGAGFFPVGGIAGGLAAHISSKGLIEDTQILQCQNAPYWNSVSAAEAGGLIGRSFGTIRNVYAYSNTEGLLSVGGVVGRNYGRLEYVTAEGTVSVSGFNNEENPAGGGGLVGRNVSWSTFTGSILNSSAHTIVDANGPMAPLRHVSLGGLVGVNKGLIEESFAASNITNIDYFDRILGGLVGINEGIVRNTYAQSELSVECGNPFDCYAGGLVGIQKEEGLIENSYSASTIDIPMQGGGLIALNEEGDVINSYWDVLVAGVTVSDGGTLSTTELMQNGTPFPGWSEEIWDFVIGDYPQLVNVP